MNTTTPTFKRCKNCLGMGYKGRSVRGKWKICTCTSCQGRGEVHESMRQRNTYRRDYCGQSQKGA